MAFSCDESSFCVDATEVLSEALNTSPVGSLASTAIADAKYRLKSYTVDIVDELLASDPPEPGV